MSRYPRKPTKSESKSKKEVRLVSNRLWKLVSEYIRRRDGKCVCCGQVMYWKELHCGHYHHNVLDFSELNLHGSCAGCNTYMAGNLTQYTLYLTRTYGHGILEALDEMKRIERRENDKKGRLTFVGHEITVELLERLIEYYTNKLKQLDMPPDPPKKPEPVEDKYDCPCSQEGCCADPDMYTPDHECSDEICEGCFETACRNCGKSCSCGI